MKLRKNEERDQRATLNSCSRMCRATLEIKGRKDGRMNGATLYSAAGMNERMIGAILENDGIKNDNPGE